MSNAIPSRRSTVLFRADGSSRIGYGHIMRCSTLASRLLERGADVHLLCRLEPGCPDWVRDSFPGVIHELASENTALSENGDDLSHSSWLPVSQIHDASQCLEVLADKVSKKVVECVVVDHYALDARWHRHIKPVCSKLVAIDDLADRDLDVDVLIDQNRDLDVAEIAYRDFVSNNTQILAGPSWSLIRNEFCRHRERERKLNAANPRLLLLMGGSDPDSLTSKALSSLISVSHPLDITAVVGEGYQLDHLRSLGDSMNHSVDIRLAERNMAALMSSADLSLSAAGSTVWELCCMGVPMVLIAEEDNQAAVVQQAELAGAAIRLPTLDPPSLKAVLSTILNGRGRLESMSRAGQSLVDGFGAERVAEVILTS